MNKLIIALCLGVASSASMAAAVCEGGAATAVASDNAVPRVAFVTTGFTPRCSANTQVDFQQNASAAAVGAASSKGNQAFGGHSNGGAVEKVSDSAAGYANPAAAMTAGAAAATTKLAAAISS